MHHYHKVTYPIVIILYLLLLLDILSPIVLGFTILPTTRDISDFFHSHQNVIRPTILISHTKKKNKNTKSSTSYILLYNKDHNKWDDTDHLQPFDNDDAIVEEEKRIDFVPNNNGPEIPRDMKYIEYNIKRQKKNYESIRSIGGQDLIHDIYVRDPNNNNNNNNTDDDDDDDDVFWFVGKVARVSDVSIEQTIARQYGLIEEHASRLRPVELYPYNGSLEIWVAPGDSEMDVAYNRPHIQFCKMNRSDMVRGAMDVQNVHIGFQGEIYEGDEEGFRTWRTKDGWPLKPEIQV